MARPQVEIDEEQVFKLAQIMCTYEEIGAFFDVNKSTISRRFATIVTKGHEHGKMSIRRKQFKLADKSATMCIWLGKQYLGQRDEAIIDQSIHHNYVQFYQPIPYTTEELEAASRPTVRSV